MLLSRSLFLLSLVVVVSTATQAFVPISTRTFRSSSTLSAKDADMSVEERAMAIEKATKAMTAFTNTYLKNTNTKLCSDLSVPAVVIKGLAEHKVTLGAPLCPCRFYDDKEAEAKDGFWNCPCVPMRERHECHCMLFLTEDNDFAGDRSVRS
jgi:ferredoxin-thioredoxin reductase catalytic chain